MPSDKREGFSIVVRNTDPVAKWISSLTRGARGLAAESTSEELIRYFRLYPHYRYKTRKSAYGKSFFSDAQRKFVMKGIRDGSIQPGHSNRTMALKKGWTTSGTGVRTRIINRVPYAGYVNGNLTQSAHEYKVGWQKVNVMLADHLKEAIDYAKEKIAAYLKAKSK